MEQYKYFYRFRNTAVSLYDKNEENYSDSEPVNFNANVAFDFNRNDSVLSCKFTVVAFQAQKICLKIVFVCEFDIKEESIEGATQADGSIVFSKSLLIQLASLNYGTLRGVLVERLKDSKMSSMILPPLYVESVIKEDYILKE